MRLTHGFAAYYGFSRLLLEGRFVPTTYEFGNFNQRLQEFEFGSVRDAPNNLPTNALTFLPLAFFRPPLARAIWTIVSLCLYFGSIRILLRANGIPWNDNLGLAGISLACLWRPSFENIAYGQLYMGLLFLFCLSIQGLVKRKELTVCLPIAATILSKGYGLINVLWFFVNKKPRSAVMILALVGTMIVLTFPLFGVGVWSTYVDKVLMTLAFSPTSGHIAYQTLNSLLLHLFSYDPLLLPSPIIELQPFHLKLLILLTNALVVAYVLLRSRFVDRSHEVFSFSTALGLTVITAPLAEQHHYVLFLPLLFGILKYLFQPEHGTVKFDLFSGVVIVAIIVLAVPIPFKLMQTFAFPWYLLGYSKLLAGMILITSSVQILSRLRRGQIGQREPMLSA